MDVQTLSLVKAYVDKTMAGKGVFRGADGRGVVSISKESSTGLVDNYKILFTDNTSYTYSVTNGASAVATRSAPVPAPAAPSIGDNGHWYIGNMDTGVSAVADLSEYATKTYVDSLNSSTFGKKALFLGSKDKWIESASSLLGLSSESRCLAQEGASLTDKEDTQLSTNDGSVLSNQIYTFLKEKISPEIIFILANTKSEIGAPISFTAAEYLPKGHKTARAKRQTVYGSLQWAIESLLNECPSANIYLVQPVLSNYLYEHLEIISKAYGIHYIKAGEESGISNFSQVNSVWQSPWYSNGDNSLNDAGANLLGSYIANKVEKSYFRKPQIAATRKKVSDYEWESNVSLGWNWSDIGYSQLEKVTKVFLSTKASDIYSTDGEKVGTVKHLSDEKNVFNTSYNSSLSGVTTGNNSGILPDAILQRGASLPAGNIANINFQIPNGVYQIGFLSSVSETAEWASYSIDPSYVSASISVGGQTFRQEESQTGNHSEITWSPLVTITDGSVNLAIKASAEAPKNSQLAINALCLRKLFDF